MPLEKMTWILCTGITRLRATVLGRDIIMGCLRIWVPLIAQVHSS